MKKIRPAVYNEEFFIKIDEPIMPTTVVSRLLGIPVWALKRIDKEGIVSPARKKDKMRLYSRNELNKLEHIWYLIKEKKVKITGLKVVLELEEKIHRRGNGPRSFAQQNYARGRHRGSGPAGGSPSFEPS